MPPSLIFGGGGIGGGVISHTWTDAASTRQLLSDLHELGIDRIDSAASYPPGSPWTTEGLLGEADASAGFAIDSKILVTRETLRGSLEEVKVAASVERSFELLKVKKVRFLVSCVVIGAASVILGLTLKHWKCSPSMLSYLIVERPSYPRF